MFVVTSLPINGVFASLSMVTCLGGSALKGCRPPLSMLNSNVVLSLSQSLRKAITCLPGCCKLLLVMGFTVPNTVACLVSVENTQISSPSGNLNIFIFFLLASACSGSEITTFCLFFFFPWQC